MAWKMGGDGMGKASGYLLKPDTSFEEAEVDTPTEPTESRLVELSAQRPVEGPAVASSLHSLVAPAVC
jgi:hypothetical protein